MPIVRRIRGWQKANKTDSLSTPSPSPAPLGGKAVTKSAEVNNRSDTNPNKSESNGDTTKKESELKAKADKDARDLADKALKSSDGFLGDNDPEPDLIESLVTDFVEGKILEGAFGKVVGRNLGITLSFLIPEVPGDPNKITMGLSAEVRAIVDGVLQDRCQVSPANTGDKGGLLEQDLKQTKPILIP